jgi:hypothetical protein
MAQKIYAILRQRRNTYEYFSQNNILLEDGQIGIISSGQHRNCFKVGDGVTRWNDLSWVTDYTILFNKPYINNIEISGNLSLEQLSIASVSALSEEEAAREAADTAHTQALVAETSARQEADTTLQGNIDAEAQARQEADSDHAALTTAHGSTATPANNRIAMYGATAGLKSNKVPSEANDVVWKTEMDAETSARQEADTTLQGNIDAEAQARQQVDGTLHDNIDAEEAAREAADSALSQDLAAESASRTSADSTLQGNKVDKHADHANGSTDIANSPDNDGFSITTMQNDTQTDFRFETNTAAGNQVIGGLVGKTEASESIGSRCLLFVNTPNGIQIHIRKNKAIPRENADLSDDDIVLNKGEIDALVNTIMVAISQGLKTPVVIDKESNLPAAEDVPNGTYYVIQQLDVTAPGQQGRAWKNDIISATEWQVVIDNVFAPDDQWISLTDNGELTIHPAVQELINSIDTLTAITGKIKIFNDILTYAADAHEDILVKRYMMTSDLCTANSFMSVIFDGLVFRVFSTTSGGNLRTDIAALSGSVIATIRRNTFYDGNTEGSTHQQATFTETSTTIDGTIYINSNDYSIYQIMIGNHWWEINLWCADAKASVMMSIERRL